MIHYMAKTSFTPWWQTILLGLTADYIVKEYADGNFHIYQGGLFKEWCTSFTTEQAALEWCERQIVGKKVKSVTFVMEDE